MFLYYIITFEGACLITSQDELGPFYVSNPPFRSNICNSSDNVDRLMISGFVYQKDCLTPIPNAKIDLWQADYNGVYSLGGDNYQCRGYIFADENGFYNFTSTMPGKKFFSYHRKVFKIFLKKDMMMMD